MPPAIIAAGIMGGTSLFGQFMGNRGANKKADAALGLQQQQAQRQSALSNTISEFARRQHTMAEPAMNKAMQYYTQLASGGRGGLQSAIAPETGMINANYRGAERGMMARMAPGGQRDAAIADLYRQRAGQIGSLGHTARSGAMNSMGNMGMNLMSQGNSMFGMASNALSGAGNQYGDVARQYQDRATQGNNNWMQMGQALGSILGPYLMGQGGGSGSSTLTNRAQFPQMWQTGMR